MKPHLFILLALLVVSGTATAQEPNPKDLVKSSLLSNVTSIQPGKPFQVGVLLNLAPHWHVYWTNVGEAGIPTTVDLSLPDGFIASAIQYPVPSRLTAPGDITMFGYEDRVMLLATITPPARIDQTSVQISAKVGWLVCDNSCIQGDAKLNIALPVGGNSSPANSELFATWNKRLPMVNPAEIADVKSTIAMSAKDKGELTLVIQWKNAPPRGIDWFPSPSETLSFAPKISISTSAEQTTIKAPFEVSSSKKISAPLESVLTYKSSAGPAGAVVPIAVDLPGQ